MLSLNIPELWSLQANEKLDSSRAIVLKPAGQNFSIKLVVAGLELFLRQQKIQGVPNSSIFHYPSITVRSENVCQMNCSEHGICVV